MEETFNLPLKLRPLSNEDNKELDKWIEDERKYSKRAKGARMARKNSGVPPGIVLGGDYPY